MKVGLVYSESVCKRIILLIKTCSYCECFTITNFTRKLYNKAWLWPVLLSYVGFAYLSTMCSSLVQSGWLDTQKRKKNWRQNICLSSLWLSLVSLLVVFTVHPVNSAMNMTATISSWGQCAFGWMFLSKNLLTTTTTHTTAATDNFVTSYSILSVCQDNQ